MFEEALKNFIENVASFQDQINTEESTKTSIIMPFFQVLGYNIFNPTEFVPEYDAKYGVKKDSKVDYAIFLNGELTTLIECKCIKECLDNHGSQLSMYYGATPAKFGVLTNGIKYQFFTDLDKPNVMDRIPFLEINLLDIKQNDIIQLKKFTKEAFDTNSIINSASELKYLNLIRRALKEDFESPTDNFVRYILKRGIYDGQLNQKKIDQYRPLIKRGISQYLNELVNDKIQNSLKETDRFEQTLSPQESVDTKDENVSNLDNNKKTEASKSVIETTMEELQCYYIIKSILHNSIDDLGRITYKDTLSYFSIILDGKVSRWICRIYLKERKKYIIINIEDQDVRFEIESVDDIYQYSEQLRKKLLELLN